MRDFSLPPLVEPLRSGGLADSVFELAAREPGLLQLARYVPVNGRQTGPAHRRARASADGLGGLEGLGNLPGIRRAGPVLDDEEDSVEQGRWREVTAAAFRDEVLALAKGLLADGVRFGDRVAVMARTCDEWTLFSYALWTVGAQVVPVYPSSSAEQLRWVLSSSRASAILVEHEEHAMTLGAACGGLPGLRRVWQLDAGCVDALTAAGTVVSEARVQQHRWAVTPESTAAIVYTSGTTGAPRGCVISHAAIAYECDTLLAGWGDLMAAEPEQQPSILAFLPLCHIYGLVVTVMCVRGGILLGHQPELSPRELLPALASFRPTCIFAVPYIFEKVFAKARMVAQESGRGRVFEQAVTTAARYAEAVEQQSLGRGSGPGPALRARHALYERLVYRRMRQVLGGRTRNVVSGASTLTRELGLVLAGAGITVYDGYGLTETTAAITAQPPGYPRFGSVGRPMPGTAVHIARDGEVWVRGEMVFSGYLDDEAATKEVLRDGWLATGDVGYLDDGYLMITGRKKDVIITTGGRSLSPQPLEERLRAHPLISQALVVGDERPYVAALITLDPEALDFWRRHRGLTPHEGRARHAHRKAAEDELEREISRAVAAVNSVVSRAESIRAFRILPTEFSVDAGLMTPSLKLRRSAIVQMYAAEIEELYAS